MDKSDIAAIVFDFIHSETGWGNPLKPQCEFGSLWLDKIEKIPEDKVKVTFRYFFDEDGFSQYDKHHILEGFVVIDTTGAIIESSLEETYTGPGTVFDPYKSQS
jgi:hypothetical protein